MATGINSLHQSKNLNLCWPSANGLPRTRPALRKEHILPCPGERAHSSLPGCTGFQSWEPGVRAVEVGVGTILPGDQAVVCSFFVILQGEPSEASTQLKGMKRHLMPEIKLQPKLACATFLIQAPAEQPPGARGWVFPGTVTQIQHVHWGGGGVETDTTLPSLPRSP